MNHINIEKIRFIKLGSQKDGKEKYCLENGKIVLGYHGINHFNSREDIKKELMQKYNSDVGAASRHANQIISFYDNEPTTLWITFAEKKFGGDR